MFWKLDKFGHHLAKFLSEPRDKDVHVATSRPELLQATLRKGDVLLVEGTSRISAAIKYLTQSTWSHAALYVGDSLGPAEEGQEAKVLVEADINEGVRAVPLSLYSTLHTRICRPVGLHDDEIEQVIQFAVQRLGMQYDLKNIFDLARYMITAPPIPVHWRRSFMEIGSADPSRAICSSLIAQAFQTVNYPVLPIISVAQYRDERGRLRSHSILHRRHHSLIAPRDFDVSPFFRVVKPAIEQGFDPHNLQWSSQGAPHDQSDTH